MTHEAWHGQRQHAVDEVDGVRIARVTKVPLDQRFFVQGVQERGAFARQADGVAVHRNQLLELACRVLALARRSVASLDERGDACKMRVEVVGRNDATRGIAQRVA